MVKLYFKFRPSKTNFGMLHYNFLQRDKPLSWSEDEISSVTSLEFSMHYYNLLNMIF